MTTLAGTTLADWRRGNLRYMYWVDQADRLGDLSVQNSHIVTGMHLNKTKRALARLPGPFELHR